MGLEFNQKDLKDVSNDKLLALKNALLPYCYYLTKDENGKIVVPNDSTKYYTNSYSSYKEFLKPIFNSVGIEKGSIARTNMKLYFKNGYAKELLINRIVSLIKRELRDRSKTIKSLKHILTK